MSDTQPAPTNVVRHHLHGALPVGTRLRAYEIEAVLGHGGFGITYRARDTALGRDVAIKEYMPAQLAFRQEDTTVVPRSLELAEDFQWGLERFLDEARTLARFDRVPGVVRVYDYLQANGTAYMVMELVKGETLQQRLNSGPLQPEAVEKLVLPLLQGLEALHAQEFLHRDIKPANVVLDEAGHPTLIDFGASRVAMAGRSTTLTAIFSPGYAAFEQMSAGRQQGPWTDIYSLSATLYHAIAGKQPPGALDRVVRESLEPLSRLKPAGFSATLLAAIDAGLALRPDKRPQTIAQWRQTLGLAAKPAPNSSPAPRARKGLWLGLGMGVAAAVLVAAGGGYLFLAERQSGEALRARLSDLLARSAPAFPVSAREAQVTQYAAAGPHKALAAYPPSGSWRSTGVASAALAEERVLEACQVRYGNPCTLLAVDDAVQPPEVAAARRPMERVVYAGPFDPQKIPTIADDVRRRSDVAAYRGTPGGKAAALHPSGRIFVAAGLGGQREAEETALSTCNGEAQRSQLDGPCLLYAVANDVVLARRAVDPVTAPPRAPPVSAGPPLDRKLHEMVEAVSPSIAATSRASRISDYLSAPAHKALAAFPPAGLWRSDRFPNAMAAEEGTLEGCQLRSGEPCVLLAVNEAVQPAEVALRRRAMPRLGYDGPFDPEKIPAVSAAVRTRADVAGYRAAPGHKAAALHPWGRLFVADRAASQRQAEEAALSACNGDPDRKNRDGSCFLYAAGDRVVLPRRATAPITPPVEPPKAEPTFRAMLLERLVRLAPSMPAAEREMQAVDYQSLINHKALAVFPSKGVWRPSGRESAALAEERALEGCQIFYGGPCLLVAVDEMLQTTADARTMPRVAYDGAFDPQKIPAVLRNGQHPEVTGYRAAEGPKAAALHAWGSLFLVTSARNQREAEERALSECNRDPERNGQNGPCFLYAVGNQVVLPHRSTGPITAVAAPPTAEPPSASATLRAGALEILARLAPQMSAGTRESVVTAYQSDSNSKALAAFPWRDTWRTSGWESAALAEERTLEGCQMRYDGPCVLVTLGDVLQRVDAEPARRSMPRIAYGGTFDPQMIPAARESTRQRADVVAYRATEGAKAAALHPWGRLFVVTGATSQRAAEERALSDCNGDPSRNNRDGPCFLYAAGNQVVLPRRSTGPITAAAAAPPAGQPAAAPTLRASLLDSLAKHSPSYSVAAREAQVSNYLSSPQHKALAAFPPSESWRRSSQASAALAEEIALEGCQVRHGGPCILVAVNDVLQGLGAGDGRRPMPRAEYAGPFDPQMVPALSPAQRERPAVAGYRSAEGPKAAAFHPIGYVFFATNARSQREAEEKVLADCNSDPTRNNQGGPCLLYAVGNQVVLTRRQTKPLTAP